jgi:hypothetical protein
MKKTAILGRPRIYESQALRQAAYRERLTAKAAQQALDLKEARELIAVYTAEHSALSGNDLTDCRK